MGATMIKEFNNKEVIVKIPDQGYPVNVSLENLHEINDKEVIPIGFHPFRLVINLKFEDATQPGINIQKFDPPIEIRVHYKEEDLTIARATRRYLCLGFWDGRRWLRFTSRKHHFQLESEADPKNGGWGIVIVSHWGDPTKAWGT